MTSAWGVISFIDALATKGIWRSHDTNLVLDSFEEVKALASKLKMEIEKASGGDCWERLSPNLATFSDSIALGIILPPEMYESQDKEFYDSARKYLLLRQVVLFLSKLVGQAVLGKVPLMYRGCISVGEMAMRGNSYIGEAVDAAGVSFESCEGAFVFLTNEAANVFTSRHPYLRIAHPAYFVPYEVPLKDGSLLKTLTINPLLLLPSSRREEAIATYIETFQQGADSASESTRRKAVNTIRYLEYLKSWQW